MVGGSTCDDLNSRKGLFSVNLAVEHDRKPTVLELAEGSISPVTERLV